MAQLIRVLIADDSARAREGLRALFSTWPEIMVVGEAADGQQAVQLVAECQPNVVLMDLHMPVLDGMQATQQIKQQWPTVTVIALTMGYGYAFGQRALRVTSRARANQIWSSFSTCCRSPVTSPEQPVGDWRPVFA